MSNPTLKPGWKTVKFGDVVSLNRDRVADPAGDGIERYVGLEHITPEDLRIHSWGLVAEGTTFTNYFQPAQVLFGKRRAYQRKVAVADFDGVCSGDIYVLEPKDPTVLLPELLPFICQTEGFYEHAVGTSAGSLSPRTNWKQLSKYEFPLPPLDEQRRIVGVLLSMDEVIDGWDKALNTIGTVINSYAKEIFEKNEWDQLVLENYVVESLYGPRFSNKLYSDNGELACIRTTDISVDGTIHYENVPRVDLSPEQWKKHILEDGDFMISRSGTCGIASVFAGNEIPTIPGAFLIRLRLKKDLNPNFLKEYINSAIGQKHMAKLARGAVQKNINGSELQSEKIPIPNVSVQELIVNEFQYMRENYRMVENRFDKAKNMKRSLLQSILYG